MGRIIDFLRNNLFWVLMILAVAAIACVHVLVAQGMAERVGELRTKGSKVVEDLRRLAGKPSIPNKKMISVAEREQGELELLYGQQFVMFSPKSGVFDRDFDAMQSGQTDELAIHGWWTEYQDRALALLAKAKTHLRAVDTVFKIKPKPNRVTGKNIEEDERVFWRTEYTIDALILATTAPRDDRSQLISKLRLVEVGRQIKGKHAWVRGTNVTIRAEMAYESIGPLVAALQNSPKPLLVRSVRSSLPDKVADSAAPAKDLSETASVELACEIVEFLPAVKQATFGGQLFANSDAIKKWVKAQQKDLHVATVALLKSTPGEDGQKARERVPGLRRRAKALLGTTLEEAGKKARGIRETEQKEIETKGAERLAKEIKAAKVKGKGKIEPARQKAIEKKHADLIAKENEAAEERYRKARLAITAKVGGFSIVYDLLRPVVPRKAYFVGLEDSMPNIVIAKAPRSAAYGADRWWMAEKGTDGKRYPPMPRNKRRPADEIISEIKEGTPGIAAIKVGGGPADAPVVLLADRAKREITQMLVPESGGGWSTYGVVRADGKPISLGDVAFRFAPVVWAVAPAIDTDAFDPETKTVTLLPKKFRAGTAFTISVPGGKIKVAAGLR